MTLEKVIITTPIFYPTAEPHVGHIYSLIVAHLLKRSFHKKGNQSVLVSGCDEHGEKVAQKALEQGFKNPQEYVDKLSEKWQSTFQKLDLSPDIFVRTTDPEHTQFVEDILTRLYEKGDIYASTFEGDYCVDCEAFLTSTEMDSDKNCLIHKKKTEPRGEENYYFKVSKYIDKVKDLIKSGSFIMEERFAQDALNIIEASPKDLSISRPISRTTWGIPFPFDKNHVLYVWVDGLLSYISRASLNKNDAMVHVIGKDILKFHAIYWPAILFALDLPQPRIIVTGWILNRDEKMSKSLGNILSSEDILSNGGLDGFIHHTIGQVPFGEDLDMTISSLQDKYQSFCVNGLGNLVSRVSKIFTEHTIPLDHDLVKKSLDLNDGILENGFLYIDYLGYIQKILRDLDKYLTDSAPWKQKDPILKQEILAPVAGALKFLVPSLSLFFPAAAKAIDDNFPKTGNTLRCLQHLTLYPKLNIPTETVTASSKDPSKDIKIASPKSSTSQSITLDEFQKIHIRVALVTECTPVPDSHSLLNLKVHCGDPEDIKNLFSGLQKYVDPKDLIGKKVFILSNLQERKMRFGISQGMLLCTVDKNDKPYPVFPHPDSELGSLLS